MMTLLKKYFYKILIPGILALPCISFSPASYQIALLKYGGGGDWYANPTSLPNLVKFANKNMGTSISEEVATVDAGNPEITNYPFVHMTGHGNVVFSTSKISGNTL